MAALLIAATSIAGWSPHGNEPSVSPWSVVPSPNLGQIDAGLNAVVAVSRTEAWAAGDGVIDRWNGALWNVSRPAKLPPGQTFQVNGLALVPGTSPVRLWAVGLSTLTNRQLIEAWSGSRWTVTPTPNLAGQSRLNSVTALSDSNAWAVGLSRSGALVEHWNGRAWNRVPAPPALSTVVLNGVGAVAANDVWAVGACSTDIDCRTSGTRPRVVASRGRSKARRANPPTLDHMVIEHWNGAKWTLIDTPGGVGDLNAIAIRSKNDIWAVGAYSNQYSNSYRPIAERWNGASWHEVRPASSASSHTFQTLQGVTAGATNVWATGYHASARGNMATIERWTGANWRLVKERHSPNALDALMAVSATPGGGPTWAAGGHIEKWNGKLWRYTPAFNAGSDNSLASIDRIPNSSGGMWAVGQFVKPSGTGALALQWRGGKWSVSRGPTIGSGLLSGVTAAGPNNAWAVGTVHGSRNIAHGLIEHWNGREWRVQISPPQPKEWWENLNAVSAGGLNDVWAVGSWYGSDGTQTLAKHWNGSAWRVVPTPGSPPNQYQSALQAVTVAGPRDVWAVGYRQRGYTTVTLIEHWNGSVWSVVSSPSPSAQTNALSGVAAVNPTDVWAVGRYRTAGGHNRALIEHWNGAQWTVAPLSRPSLPDSSLAAVSAANGAGVWAGGTYGSPGGQRALVEHWNGVRWSTQTPPSPDLGAQLSGIWAGGSPRSVWIAGSYVNDSDRQRTLTEKRG